tara:strand:+ start:759 stop:1184 length:426 start_codon:yes stop_codon:yes gene_type:complete
MYWTVVITSLLLGSMLFFTIVITPTVFSTLNEVNARKFIRKIFPKIYLWCMILNFLLIILLLKEFDFKTLLAILSFVFFIYSRQLLTPKINYYAELSNKKIKNNSSQLIEKSAKKFKVLHSLSVILFASSFLCMLFILFTL